ncbi:MAG: tetratricopeptide repeat protein, partial [Candidatus Binatia bacterium]
MITKQLLAPTCLSALIYVSGCAGVGQDVAAGRLALQTGRANEAVAHLMRAAEADPSYKLPYRIQEGVLSYLGRAYYETGKNAEARKTLEKAVSLDKDDPLARLYLGLTLLRDGDRERGRKEVEGGLKAIDDTLEYIASDRLTGFYWDPGMEIRNDVRKTLAAKLDGADLAVAGQRIGKQFDEEIDKARR